MVVQDGQGQGLQNEEAGQRRYVELIEDVLYRDLF
jgi:hypothetical protein